MNNKVRKQLTNIAYHEAGHAVISYFLGVPFKFVTIVPNVQKETAGHVETWPIPKWFKPDMEHSPKVKERIEYEIIIFCAGLIAEKHYAKRYNYVTAGHDLSIAATLSMYINGNEKSTNAYIKWLMIRTEDMVTFGFRWKAIETVANELLKKQTLTSNEVKSLIQLSMKY